MMPVNVTLRSKLPPIYWLNKAGSVATQQLSLYQNFGTGFKYVDFHAILTQFWSEPLGRDQTRPMN